MELTTIDFLHEFIVWINPLKILYPAASQTVKDRTASEKL